MPAPVDPHGNVLSLRAAAQSSSSVLLTGPIDPDGDSIGASLALARGLRALGVSRVDVAGTPGHRYAWMPDADTMIPDEQITATLDDGRPYDLVIVLDGDKRRLSDTVNAAFLGARQRAIVDHHGSTEPTGYDVVLLDRAADSTCRMVYDVLTAWGLPIDVDVAAMLYAGLIFDTGGFRHSNTTPETHRLAARLLETGIDHARISVRILMERRQQGLRLLGRVLERSQFRCDGQVAWATVSLADVAALGATNGDQEGIVDALLYTRGVELACLFIEKTPGHVKLSLRSRRRVDVAALARQLAPGGGGHARAAGVMLDQPLEQVLDRIPARLCEAVRS